MKEIILRFILSLIFFPGFIFFISAITDLFDGKRTVVKYEDGAWKFDREDW